MGVPSFYRWLVHRYPNVVVNAKEARATGNEEINTSDPNPNGIEFDNLYLDMNGIIHPCFHPEDDQVYLLLALQFYVRSRLNNDPGWKHVKVILSDANVPGEGEHKVMNFIRLLRNLPGYEPNTRHCLYGLDADLIMLALASHGPHFAILRGKLCYCAFTPSIFRRGQFELPQREVTQVQRPSPSMQSLVKKPYQYLELDLRISDPPFAIDIEKIIDDFILMCFFAGNDFLPHIPSLNINEGAIDLLMVVYKDKFRSLGGYLVDMEKVKEKKASYMKLKRVEKFILAVGTYEDRIFKKRADLKERTVRSYMRKMANEQAAEVRTQIFRVFFFLAVAGTSLGYFAI
ncbi:hypothetical protein MKW92_051749 [Papaver armeniacum]|nr:hypothetical protein MKW92_051749 [Papaver armeniacum]